jgi:hypothetical protein
MALENCLSQASTELASPAPLTGSWALDFLMGAILSSNSETGFK